VGYPNLPNVSDPALRQALKILADRLNALQASQRTRAVAQPSLSTLFSMANQRLTNLGNPGADQDGVTQGYAYALIEQAIDQYAALVGTSGAPGSIPGIHPPAPGGFCNTNLALGQPGGVPNSLRWFKGNFCGIRVPGIEPVAGGSPDASLVFTPFLDRYSPDSQNAILTSYVNHGYTHFKLSWPDSRDGAGQSPAQFVATCQLVQSYGLNPVVFLSAKGNDDPNNYPAAVNPVIGPLIAAGALPIACVGWELSLWMDPTQCQQAIDYLVSQGVTEASGHNLYVHFQTGYASFQQPGQFTAAFWQTNVGKLTGMLYQADPGWSCSLLQGGDPVSGKSGLGDVLDRCAGRFGWPADCGFGHPVDCVADEMTAMTQFFNGLSEGGGDEQGFHAICTPAASGPLGTVTVMGSNNGFHT